MLLSFEKGKIVVVALIILTIFNRDYSTALIGGKSSSIISKKFYEINKRTL